MASRAFSPPDRTRHFFSTSSPEKPKQPASARSEPCPAWGKEGSRGWGTGGAPGAAPPAGGGAGKAEAAGQRAQRTLPRLGEGVFQRLEHRVLAVEQVHRVLREITH